MVRPLFAHCDMSHINLNFFRAFINSELGLPEVAPCMAQTFGGVSGHWRRTGSEPHPAKYGARNSHISQMVLEGHDGY